eukprot:m.118855 g.118855  ORF g.118855 m.118855 type:complete len:394 (-) comp16444_c0_seq1:146-1327(-)
MSDSDNDGEDQVQATLTVEQRADGKVVSSRLVMSQVADSDEYDSDDDGSTTKPAADPPTETSAAPRGAPARPPPPAETPATPAAEASADDAAAPSSDTSSTASSAATTPKGRKPFARGRWSSFKAGSPSSSKPASPDKEDGQPVDDIPAVLRISNCGVPAVDGVYNLQRGQKKGKPWWKKTGGLVDYRLSWDRNLWDRGIWGIWDLVGSGNLQYDVESEEPIPPTEGWKARKAPEPLPSISYNFLLSFNPEKSSLALDGKVTEVAVTGFLKRYDVEQNKYYTYTVEVKREGKPPQQLFRRFSEFNELNAKLLYNFPVKLPEFPGKIYFGRSHTKQVTEKRAKALDAYLKGLLTVDKEVSESDYLYAFLHSMERDSTDAGAAPDSIPDADEPEE